MTILEILRLLERVSGIKAPTRRLPMPLLYAVAAGNEIGARVSRRPVLVSLAVVRLMAAERDRTRFDHSKSERELGIRFRPVEETFKDVISWYRENGWWGDQVGVKASLPPSKPALKRSA